jgi:hypothetical protein
MNARPTPRSDRGFHIGLAGIGLIALLLREWFVLVSVTEAPIRGDIVQYVAYAWNLLYHGTFSLAAAGTVPPPPDAFRGPGYPAFLALFLAAGEADGSWYTLAVQAQVLLGAATCVLLGLTARRWQGAIGASGAALLLALWPHHIVASGALLSEIFLGFLLVLGIFLLTRSSDSRSVAPGLLAGAVLAVAYLTNPLIGLLVPVLCAVQWRFGERRSAVTVFGLVMLCALAWQIRGAVSVSPSTPSPNRALINLVEGSWPLYHAAYNSRDQHEVPRQILQAIVEEEQLIQRDLRSGLESIGRRFAEDPAYYARWYLLQKPYLLWSWDIQIGAGDVYFHRVSASPLETNAVLRAVKTGLEVINPAMFVLAILGMLIIANRLRYAPRDDHVLRGATLVAGAFAYFTLIHGLLQAEPRYAIAYRPIEFALVTACIGAIVESVSRYRARRRRSEDLARR